MGRHADKPIPGMPAMSTLLMAGVSGAGFRLALLSILND
jgi:hypothetical protein